MMFGDTVPHKTGSASYSAAIRAGSHLLNASAQACVADVISAFAASGDCMVWQPATRPATINDDEKRITPSLVTADVYWLTSRIGNYLRPSAVIRSSSGIPYAKPGSPCAGTTELLRCDEAGAGEAVVEELAIAVEERPHDRDAGGNENQRVEKADQGFCGRDVDEANAPGFHGEGLAAAQPAPEKVGAEEED